MEIPKLSKSRLDKYNGLYLAYLIIMIFIVQNVKEHKQLKINSLKLKVYSTFEYITVLKCLVSQLDILILSHFVQPNNNKNVQFDLQFKKNSRINQLSSSQIKIQTITTPKPNSSLNPSKNIFA